MNVGPLVILVSSEGTEAPGKQARAWMLASPLLGLMPASSHLPWGVGRLLSWEPQEPTALTTRKAGPTTGGAPSSCPVTAKAPPQHVTHK